MSVTSPIPFDNTYAALSDRFYTRTPPTPVAKPGPIRVNEALAADLGISAEWLRSPEGTAMVAGNRIPVGADPIATVYAGHQFGNYNPQLGDGRAILLGEVVSGSGERFDIQLKGCGTTPYSRRGDGRSPLGPVLREYIVSEAMSALGVPTTRSLAAVTTGEQVLRREVLPGGVLARVASSHIRIGTFQFFAARRDVEALQLLSDHATARHFPEAADAENPTLALLNGVVERQAQLVAQWQLFGFVHGVMNTDNMLICGETIDYGPCAYMDRFDLDTVFSSIDHGGRYAYRNQPSIAQWNLGCFAQVLLPLIASNLEEAVELAGHAVGGFVRHFETAYLDGMGKKLGMETLGEADLPLVESLFALMTETAVDFTLTFRRLADLAFPESAASDVGEVFALPKAFTPWLDRWRSTWAADALSPAERQALMYGANPAYIARNHLVEAAIVAAREREDFGPFHRLVDRLAAPHRFDPADARHAMPPTPEEVVCETFCGT